MVPTWYKALALALLGDINLVELYDFIAKWGYNFFVPLWLHARFDVSFVFVARLDTDIHKSIEFCFLSK